MVKVKVMLDAARVSEAGNVPDDPLASLGVARLPCQILCFHNLYITL